MLKICTLFICLGFMSCGSRQFSVGELKNYIHDEENGLQKSQLIGNSKITVSYYPTDLLIDHQLSGGQISQRTIDSLTTFYSSYYYFILSLSHDNSEVLRRVGTFEEYSDMVQRMCFRMNEYASLSTSSDTIPVADHIINRTYGLSSSTDIMVLFNKTRTQNCNWVQVNLREFGLGIGNQKFRFLKDDLEDAPRVSFLEKNNLVFTN